MPPSFHSPSVCEGPLHDTVLSVTEPTGRAEAWVSGCNGLRASKFIPAKSQLSGVGQGEDLCGLELGSLVQGTGQVEDGQELAYTVQAREVETRT